MATKSTQTSNFDFATFNDLTEKAPTGLKLWVAQKMLEDAQITMLRFKSPLLSDITDILAEVNALREANKKYLATRDNRGTDDTALQPTQHTNSGDYAKE
jgi:hypothetical protein